MNLSGKICLITGGSSGLGLAAAKKMAGLGAKVTLLCRNLKKGEDALAQIRKEIPDASAEVMICDLASLESVRNFVRAFKEKHPTLDILFNNAAVMKMQRGVTGDGLEEMFQVNYLAPVLLTVSLIDLLKKSPAARIINIAVPPPKLTLDLEDLQSLKNYSAFTSFFRSKLCLLLFSFELSQKLTGSGINLYVTDPGPGPFKSDLSREAPGFMKWMMRLLAAPVEKPTETIIYLASADEVQNKNGRVFIGKQEKSLAPYWNKQDIRSQLWSITHSLIGKEMDLI